MRYQPDSFKLRSFRNIKTKRNRPSRVVLLVVAIASLVAIEVHIASPSSAGSMPRFPLPYAGVNYYDPSVFYTRCPSYTWLQNACWNNSHLATSPRQQLISDLKFVSKIKLDGVQSVSISLDEILQENSQTGPSGFVPGTLNNVDDMLSIYHQYGVKALLILFVYDHPGAQNEFKPWAIDGDHPQMEANYLQAAYQFIRHIASNSTDSATAPIVDLQDEAYYQFEVYYSNPSHLGKFTECRTHNPKIPVDTGCIDTKIVHPWLQKLYDTARSASTKLLYTISDTHRLFEDYKAWINMYPVDIIDEHLYDSTPWSDASMYTQGKHFDKPWFVGEAGCASYATGCTYVANTAQPVDNWWLQNLYKDGAQAVFIEDKHTAWGYGPTGANDQVPTSVGIDLQHALKSITPIDPGGGGGPTPTPTPAPGVTPTPTPISHAPSCPSDTSGQRFYDSFDSAARGALRTSVRGNHFSGAVGRGHIQVENFLQYSKPQALAISVPRGGSAYVSRSFKKAHFRCQLQFELLLGHGFSLAQNNYMVLAEVRAGSASNGTTGKAQLTLGGGGNLIVSYFDGYGHQQYLYTKGKLSIGTWYRLALREVTGTHGASISAYENGRLIGTVANLDLGESPIRYFAVGDEYTPHAVTTSGAIYLDNVQVGGSSR